MKKTFLYSIIMMLSIVLLSQSVKANSAAGGELFYVHIADSSYQVFLTYYRDCSGGAEPDTLPLCMYNPCTNNTLSFKMGKWNGTIPGGGSPIIGPPCNNLKTNCDSVGSTVMAYREWWYSVIVTMPSRCNAWKLFTYGPARNNIDNYQNPSSSSFYIEATMNNALSHVNSSPYYAVRPMYAVPQNQAYTYNYGALDADGDSLWTEVIMLRTGVSTCTDTAVNMSFTSKMPAYNLTNNPFQTNNSFNLNGGTGQMSFTSTVLGRSNIAFRTKEYRNGVLIGSTMREMQMQTLPLPSNAPIFRSTLDSGGFWHTYNYGCIGDTMTVTTYISSTDTNSLLDFTDNANTATSGGSVVYTNLGKGLYKAVFKWLPSINDVGNHSVQLYAIDTFCRASGFVYQWSDGIDIKIWGPTIASANVSICLGKHAFLGVTGGGNYNWIVLSGDTAQSLSNPNVPNPVATPKVTTTYLVYSSINPYCTSFNSDTVTVTVLPPSPGSAAVSNTFGCGFADPGINYVVRCVGEQLWFCLNSTSSYTDAKLYQHSNAGAIMQGANVSYSNQGTDSAIATFNWTPGPNDGGLYSLQITTSDSACVPANITNKKIQTIDVYVWPATKTIADTFICAGDSIRLSTTGGSGFSWAVLPGGSANSLSNPYSSSPFAKPIQTTSYAVTGMSAAGCTNNKDTVTITIPLSVSTPSITATTVSPDSFITMGTAVTFTAAAIGCTNPQYNWVIDGVAVNGANQSTYTSTTLTDEQKVWCVLTCKDSCSNPSYALGEKITVYVSSSVDDIDQTNKVRLYPNPNNGSFSLLLDKLKGESEPVEVQIINMYGQVVYEKQVTGTKEQINLDNAAAGMYILKAKHMDRTSILKFNIR